MSIRTRIYVALVGIPILIIIIYYAPIWVFACFAGLVSALSAWELIRCVSPDSPIRFRVYAMLSGLAIPVICAFRPGFAEAESVLYFIETETVLYILTLVMFCELIASFWRWEWVKLKTALLVLFAGGFMPIMLSSLVSIGLCDNPAAYLLLPFVAAFSSDSGGYFSGKLFGRHKAFPRLSPNKTVEGCLGGLVFAVAAMLLYGLILMLLKFKVNYVYLAVYGLAGSLVCQIGDLAFSAIKRQYGIKDFGTLIPGHGGALDRFDSMHFTAPALALLAAFLPAISK